MGVTALGSGDWGCEVIGSQDIGGHGGWRARGLEGIGAKGHEVRSFRGRRLGGGMVREHRKWDLHESDVGGVGGPGPIVGGCRRSKD